MITRFHPRNQVEGADAQARPESATSTRISTAERASFAAGRPSEVLMARRRSTSTPASLLAAPRQMSPMLRSHSTDDGPSLSGGRRRSRVTVRMSMPRMSQRRSSQLLKLRAEALEWSSRRELRKSVTEALHSLQVHAPRAQANHAVCSQFGAPFLLRFFTHCEVASSAHLSLAPMRPRCPLARSSPSAKAMNTRRTSPCRRASRKKAHLCRWRSVGAARTLGTYLRPLQRPLMPAPAPALNRQVRAELLNQAARQSCQETAERLQNLVHELCDGAHANEVPAASVESPSHGCD